jgi:serine/threonine protein kinase
MQVYQIGKYRIIAKLGQGGMATVYLSVVPGPAGVNKLLVVKTLKDELSQDQEFLEMFLNEARLAARLNHANVVQTYEIGIAGSTHFLAMDYLDGQPLHAVLRRATRARMPLDVHVRILAETLAGLHYAHTLRDFDGTALQVVHRDVSPQNVFVTYDGQVKVVDFGIAKAVGASTATQSGVFKGKISYVAPEQASGDPIDARADIFSVGVMLWEAMAGARFAQGDGQTAVLARRLAGNEPRIRDVVPNADPMLADICDRAMAHDRNLRYPTAESLRDALENYLDHARRRVSAREISELMNGLFAEEREAIRQVIDDQMKRLLRETQQALPVPSLDMHGVPSDATPHTYRGSDGREPSLRGLVTLPGHASSADPSLVTGSAPTGPGTLASANLSQRPEAVAGASRAVLVALGVLAALSVVATVAVFLTRSSSPPTVDTISVVASAPATPERIQVSIAFGPEGAVAKLDGVPLSSNPFKAQVARDGSMHRLEVEAPGYEPQTTMVSYDKDVVVAIALTPKAEPAASATTSSGPVPFGPSSKPIGGGTVGAWPVGARPGPMPDSRNPPGTKVPRPIDEQDPYKK